MRFFIFLTLFLLPMTVVQSYPSDAYASPAVSQHETVLESVGPVWRDVSAKSGLRVKKTGLPRAYSQHAQLLGMLMFLKGGRNR